MKAKSRWLLQVVQCVKVSFFLRVGLEFNTGTRLYGADIAFMGLKFLGDTKFTTLQNPHLLKSLLPAG